LTSNIVDALALSNTNVFAGTQASYLGGGGVFLSTNSGTSWSRTGLTNLDVSALLASGTNLFAATYSGVFLSTNNGTTWTEGTPAWDGASVISLAASVTNLFAGTNGLGVFLSTDRGITWNAANFGLPVSWVLSLAVDGNSLFAGTGAGVFLSTNNGTTWAAVNTGLSNYRINALTVSETNLFAGTGGGGVFLSTNKGTTWTAVNPGLMRLEVYSLVVNGADLYAGTFGGVFRRPLSEMTASVQIPAAFTLRQNYPNPFNAGTTIRYELPIASHVSLTVYDILGRQVSVLVNDRRNAGVYEVKFDGSNLASGVYFYRLQAENYVATRRFLLVK
jgi:hypothetical protein